MKGTTIRSIRLSEEHYAQIVKIAKLNGCYSLRDFLEKIADSKLIILKKDLT